jgi:drug/metabolite transporter (DMT)-like permease
MWLFLALLSSIFWGLSYAAAGRLFERGLSPLGFYFTQLVCGIVLVGAVFASGGRAARFASEFRALGPDWIWLAVAGVASTAAGLLIFHAIDHKNAPVAGLIEISYPLGAAFFAWLFFRESHLNLQTAIGAALIYSGIIVVALGNRG